MNVHSLVRADRLFCDVLDALRTQEKAPRPLPLVVNGLSSGALDGFCTCLTEEILSAGGRALFLAQDETAVNRVVAYLREAGIRALPFPVRDPVLYEYTASHDVERERLFALHAFGTGEADVLVATPDAATAYTVPPERLAGETFSLSVGDQADPDVLTRRLTAMGYAPAEAVEGVGQFARRGGILDLYPRSDGEPYRIEFFGDEVDRICHFDPLTQRVTTPCDNICLLPAYEVLPTEQDCNAVRNWQTEQLKKAEGAQKDLLKRELAHEGTDLPARDRYISLIYPERCTLFSYIPPRTPVIVLGTNEVMGTLKGAVSERKEAAESLVERGLLPREWASFGEDERAYARHMRECIPVYLNAFTSASVQEEGGLFGYRCRRLPTYVDGLKALSDDLTALLKQGYTAYLVCENRAGMESTVSYLTDNGVRAVIAPDTFTPETAARGVAYAVVGNISGGYDLITPRVAVISLIRGSGEGRKLRPRARKKHAAGQVILSYAELKTGDYVVHEKYGIGIFEGMEQIANDGVLRDYITIRYAGTDKLFIPADRLESITKYIGAGSDGTGVKLSRMGSAAWTKTKARAKGAAREMAQELIRLYAARQRKPGIPFPPQEEMETEFNGNFAYELTEPQETAVAEILSDMGREVPMDRLLCGDVGFGKTEVALRAAFRAIANGYQVAILVPTTILALQHYETALNRMRGFAVQVDMLSRFRTPKQQQAILRRLARGQTDLIIGTHSLLGNGVKFKKLGLLIVDEEQRFGVGQKEKIKELAQDVDVLTLSATPIPRTLNMAISGIRDMSVLDEAPEDRRPVQTYVMEYHDEVVRRAIVNELTRAGQVLYLYNDTESIDLVAGKVQQMVPSARVAYAHGKMEKEQIEDIWQALVRGEIDVLVCTTIIETGVDLPQANTLIVENADRLGLSQLHQLRGRIGRSSRQAFAYFTYRQGKSLTEIATKRLSAIREYAEFGAGFRIALRDLEIRGAGSLLGASQHGHIESVGYDMYVHLLESAVLEEQGTVIPPAFESTVEIRMDANIPANYIPSSSQRMEMYKKISCIETEADLRDVLDEFCDRFGDPPVATQRLLYVSLARASAARARIRLVEQVQKEIRLWPEGVELPVWSEVFHRIEGVSIPSGRTPYLAARIPAGQDPAKFAARFTQVYETAKKEGKT